MNGTTLILGLGNTILSDDAAGIIIARQLYEALRHADRAAPVELAEASYAGWRLVDLITGYGRLIIIDSIQTGQGVPGECYKVENGKISSIHLQSSHGLGLHEAIELARADGQEVPREISVYAVEVVNPFEFGERMNPEVERRIPEAVRQIMTAEGFTARER